MAHFAELDETNTVIQVIVVHNNELLNDDGTESEQRGIDFCIAHYGGQWVQTSYNGNFRKRYAGIGFTYDKARDAFVTPRANCHDNELFNENTLEWECNNDEHFIEL